MFREGYNRLIKPTDCEIVYALHTNGNHVGSDRHYGSVDIIANNDSWQNGCPWTRPICSHMRGIIYFIESMRSCKYIIKSDTVTDVFGLNSRNIPGNYTMETSSCYPFCPDATESSQESQNDEQDSD